MSADRHERRDRLIQEKRRDAYEESHKWPEPTVCTECGALFVDGRWKWAEGKQSGHEVICPACRRIADDYPAGYVEMKGPFFNDRRSEILSLVYHTEDLEKSDHPMERIISTTEHNDRVLITTTGVHLARRIGEALSRAYKGDFSFHYTEGDKIVRVYWQR